MNSQNRAYYDHEAAFLQIQAKGGRGWDDYFPRKTNDSYEGLRVFLSSELAPRAASDVTALDLGCGGGQAALLLAHHGYAVTGVDVSPTAIVLAERNAKDEGLSISFQVDDCLKLGGIGDRTMDLVVDNHALHCLVTPSDRCAFLTSAKRVLKPGGLLFSETMSCEGYFDPLVMGADPVTRIYRDGNRIWVTRAELLTELAEAGFEVLHESCRSQSFPGGDLLITIARRLH